MRLLLLLVQRVLAAARTVLVDLQTIRIIAPILLRGVITLLAHGAGKRNRRANIFLSHCPSLFSTDNLARDHGPRQKYVCLDGHLGDDPGADRQTPLANREAAALLQR